MTITLHQFSTYKTTWNFQGIQKRGKRNNGTYRGNGGGLHNPFEIEISKGLGVKFKNLLCGGGGMDIFCNYTFGELHSH